jgi:heterodisulfide reductase subunit A
MIVDLAVLATSLVPRKGVEKLAKVLGVDLDEYNFFKTDALNPLDTTKPGIFVCGCCREPTDIPESVAQASGAAERAAETVIR